MIRSAQCSLSARNPSDRQSDHPGWNWHRSRSASPAGPHDGRRGWTCHHDAPERQRPPTRIQHAQVRFSWTSVHSSTKTPHKQKRHPKQQVNAPPLRWARRNPNSTRHRLPGLGHFSPRRSFIRPRGQCPVEPVSTKTRTVNLSRVVSFVVRTQRLFPTATSSSYLIGSRIRLC